MKSNWYCNHCNARLGEREDSTLLVRYRRDVQLLVEGSDYRVTRTCRRCATLNTCTAEEVTHRHMPLSG